MGDDFEIAVRAQRALLPKLFDIASGYEGGLVKTTHAKVPHIAHGWYRRVVNGVGALLTLEQAGFVGESPPLRRSILEHNVALAWVVEEGNGIVDPLARGHKHSVEKLRDILDEGEWDAARLAQFQVALESVGDRDNKNDNLLQFATRVARYGTPDEAMQVLFETRLSHATYESAVAYWDLDSQEVSDSVLRVIDQGGFAARQLLQGIAQYVSIFVDPPRLLELAEIGIQLREIDRRYRNATGQPIPEEYGEDENSPIPGLYDPPEQSA